METFLNGGSLAGSAKQMKAAQNSKKKARGKNAKEQVETLIEEGKYLINFRRRYLLYLPKTIREWNGHDWVRNLWRVVPLQMHWIHRNRSRSPKSDIPLHEVHEVPNLGVKTSKTVEMHSYVRYRFFVFKLQPSHPKAWISRGPKWNEVRAEFGIKRKGSLGWTIRKGLERY